MRKIAFMVLFLGFLPAFGTAMLSEGCLTFLDYCSAFGGFFLACLLLELKYEH